jgi:hypothetical protein
MLRAWRCTFVRRHLPCNRFTTATPFASQVCYASSRLPPLVRLSTTSAVNIAIHKHTDQQIRLGPSSVERSDAQRKTIYALATASGPAAIAVIRISGPDVREIRKCMLQSKRVEPVPWMFERCNVVDPALGEVLDDALAVFFPGDYFLAASLRRAH